MLSIIDTSAQHSTVRAPARHRPTGDGDHSWVQLSCRLQMLPGPAGHPVTVLVVHGQLDFCTQLLARNALAAALATAPGPVVVDLSGLDFCSTHGLVLLTTPTATAAGHPYLLAAMSRHLSRFTARLAATGHPTRYRTTTAAVTALHTAATPPACVGSPTGTDTADSAPS